MACQLNGITVYPINIERQRKKYGVADEAADGTATWTQLGEKSEWTLTWEDASSAELLSVASNVYALTSSFTFKDETGASYSVICRSDAMTHSISCIAGDGTYCYAITLKLRQV